jgi:hypothetical protein
MIHILYKIHYVLKVTNMPLGTESAVIPNNVKKCEAKLMEVILKHMPQTFVIFNLQMLQISIYVCNNVKKSNSSFHYRTG